MGTGYEIYSQLINYLRFGKACLNLSFPVKLAVTVVGRECLECLVNYVDLRLQICGSIVGNFRVWCGIVIQFQCLNTSARPYLSDCQIVAHRVS
jgi:hypothetical protein